MRRASAGAARPSGTVAATSDGGAAGMPWSSGETAVLVALAAILGVTAAWWAAALWPLPAGTPDWVVRARAACFGIEHSGLPHAGGWILLVGSPLSMGAALVVIWGGTLRTALGRLLATKRGAFAASLAMLAFFAVTGVSGARAAAAAGWSGFAATNGVDVADYDAPLRRLDEAPGALGLRDQRKEHIDLSRFAGAPLLVTFAFGKCETVCPLLVEESLAARAVLAARAEPGANVAPLVIITVDPWRDSPARLPHIAAAWRLDDEAHLLGGSVGDVERVLDSWRLERSRDERTGEVVHPSLVYVLDGRGRIVYGVPGWRAAIVRAVEALAGTGDGAADAIPNGAVDGA